MIYVSHVGGSSQASERQGDREFMGIKKNLLSSLRCKFNVNIFLIHLLNAFPCSIYSCKLSNVVPW